MGERGNTRNEEDFYDRAAFYKHSVFVCLWEPVVTKTPEESGKTTVAAVDVSDTEAFNMAEELVKNMSLEEKVGQMFLVSLSKLDDP